MYPQERFAYYKRPFWPVLFLKRIGYLAELLLILSLLARYILSCYQTTPLLTILALADITLLKPLVIYFCSSLGSTLLLIEKATIYPIYLWVINPKVCGKLLTLHRKGNGVDVEALHDRIPLRQDARNGP